MFASSSLEDLYDDTENEDSNFSTTTTTTITTDSIHIHSPPRSPIISSSLERKEIMDTIDLAKLFWIHPDTKSPHSMLFLYQHHIHWLKKISPFFRGLFSGLYAETTSTTKTIEIECPSFRTEQ